MPVPSSGTIDVNQFHVEAGGASGTQCTINDADIRGLIGKASGAQMAFNEWYGATAPIPDFSATMNVGHTTATSTSGYTTTSQAAKGFISTSASQPLFGTNNNNVGSLSSTSNANYFGGNIIHGLCMFGSTNPPQTTGNIHLYVATLNISNSDASFKSVVINGSTYTRSSANYNTTTFGGFSYSNWTWNGVQASLTNSSATLSSAANVPMGPFPAATTNITITFKRT